ncbi:DNA methyltransferase [Kingella kingae]|uniref:DNA methyltransferase n=1 Tax=Kingella kingae TaxID=504 RepID=UPI002550B0BF|nr:DNA methyltransferase [Kingella kingae]MDK4567618.1 DNA methyltransferase [Kingella kingae]MDK4639263.1 DNA methyltransferase [Kingella kingae]
MFDTKFTVFSNPKPLELIKSFLSICQDNEFLVMDFFAGSATLAHAVHELNASMSKDIKFIAIQLPEELDIRQATSNKAKKIIQETINFLEKRNLPTTIAEVAKERIRRVGKQISDRLKEGQSVDTGFKVFKLSTSNFKQWQPQNGENLPEQLQLSIDTVAEHGTVENMLYELMLRLGCKLTSQISHENQIYWVTNEDTGSLIVLLLEAINQDLIDWVLTKNPAKVITIDKLFDNNDSLKTNTVLQMKDAGVVFECI